MYITLGGRVLLIMNRVGFLDSPGKRRYPRGVGRKSGFVGRWNSFDGEKADGHRAIG